jgi:hypothetical protein
MVFAIQQRNFAAPQLFNPAFDILLGLKSGGVFSETAKLLNLSGAP